ncbi:hypothetical protein [Pseudogulbenkiania sp. MAI-1]|uniref:hypothetical protein n=1 Tax=Pseudogulbenkiania sp. MAI-1 TaxID=990370 RepID=UPI00045E8805|nr:hypothetical protein [Pseudogulbenkiania sp. MAI-1]
MQPLLQTLVKIMCFRSEHEADKQITNLSSELSPRAEVAKCIQDDAWQGKYTVKNTDLGRRGQDWEDLRQGLSDAGFIVDLLHDSLDGCLAVLEAGLQEPRP